MLYRILLLVFFNYFFITVLHPLPYLFLSPHLFCFPTPTDGTPSIFFIYFFFSSHHHTLSYLIIITSSSSSCRRYRTPPSCSADRGRGRDGRGDLGWRPRRQAETGLVGLDHLAAAAAARFGCSWNWRNNSGWLAVRNVVASRVMAWARTRRVAREARRRQEEVEARGALGGR
ncbi:hypothetical protein Tsubulata_044750 [Turnera subulata]|uniref:Uncharacterized protein n=1 Tax=Turnera subulata TaxID=218843 RepID=A0A9Q0FHJ7_9ROSI|nr:hypothetical protein Tsubulata_044750 [Turnera subulata]